MIKRIQILVYELTQSSFDKWVCQHKNTSPFEIKNNRTPEQEELSFSKENSEKERV